MNNTYSSVVTPEVHITTNKNRIKRYNSNNSQPIYYLKDKQNFQLELYNPTQDIVNARIFINGKQLSGGSIVLKPAERVFLDRYLDSPQKFVFETYEVGNSTSDKIATANNGLVRVEFFKEKQSPQLLFDSYRPIQTPPFNPNGTGGYFYGTTTDCNTYYNSTLTASASNTSFTTTNCSNTMAGFDSLDAHTLDFSPKVKKTKSLRKTETGMIGKGEVSEQVFKNVHYEFETLPFHSIEYKILPISVQQRTTSTLNVVQYCTECGSKLKPTHKFCSNCGNKR